MRNFSMLALEERIVLDATLVNAADFVTKTINVGEAVDLSGGLHMFSFVEFPSWLVLGAPFESGAILKTGGSAGDLLQVQGQTDSSFQRSLLGFGAASQAVTYNAPGTYNVLIDFSDSFGIPDLLVGVITVVAPPPPLVEINVSDISAVEGSTLNGQKIGSFVSNFPLAQASDFIVQLTSSNLSRLNFGSPSVIEETDGTFSIYANLSLNDYLPNGNIHMSVTSYFAGLQMDTVVHITDAPLTLRSNALITGTEGITLHNQLLATFRDGNSLTNASAFLQGLTVTANDPSILIDASSLQIVTGSSGGGGGGGGQGGGQGGGGGQGIIFFEIRGDVTFTDYVSNGALNIHVQDADGGPNVLDFNVPILVIAPPELVPGSAPNTAGIEGQLFNDLNLISFTSDNPNAQVSDFTSNILPSPLDPNSNLVINSFNDTKITQDALGVFHLTVDLGLGFDLTPLKITSTITDQFGNAITAIGVVGMNQSPKTLGPIVSLDLPIGTSSMVKIGSFTDANPFEPAGNYVLVVDGDINSSANGSANTLLVNTGAGTYDVYADLSYAASGSKVGSFSIHELDVFGGIEAGSLVTGSFNVNVRSNQQLLWGVDENTGKLFSVADYAQPGAANRVTVYGQLHTASGVIIGSGIDAFTIDATDANGKNAAYFAVSKAVAGINTFSIGVIADINDLAHNTEVKLYTISGMTFNMAKDAITGLAVDPITGNLMGVVVSGATSSSSLFVIDKNSLQSSNQVAKAYNLGKLVGSDDSSTQLGQAINQILGLFGVDDLIGGMKITNARDLAFDNAGRLFVTDGAKDILYQINAGNGEIIGIANAKEANGLPGNPNIEALAWDPVAGKLIGASSVGNLSDLIGLSVTGGPNTLTVDNLVNLQDVQGMAFKPQFAYHGGADLGIVIDFANRDLEYKPGDKAVLLLQSVDLISYGSNNYAGSTLNVDVSDNANTLTDQLAISNGGDIKVVGSEVRYKGLLIGMIDNIENGKNGKDLTIHFNGNANEKAVEALMNRISYMNTANSLVLGNKTVAFSITDSLGAVIGYTTVDLEIERNYLRC